MLIRFGITNHLSINEPQELSLAASSLKDESAGLIPPLRTNAPPLLPAAVLYGANASGKSNIVRALRFFRDAVLNSHRESEPGKVIGRAAFRLTAEAEQRPTRMDADLIVDGVRHHYGFEASNDAFVAEWLYAFPAGRRQMLFERNDQVFTFGRALKGRNRVIADLTRKNSLFLSAAAQNDHADLTPLWSAVQSWSFDTNVRVNAREFNSHYALQAPDRRIVAFLSDIGTGIIDIETKKEALSDDDQAKLKAVVTAIADLAGAQPEPALSVIPNVNLVSFIHQATDGTPVRFSPMDESDGTRRLVVLMDAIFRALDSGSLLVVDEINANLHTKAAEAILALFSDRATNPKGAQIVATTHDTNLLRAPFLRRDQVWFTEKDEGGATHLYPLSDFRTRTGDNFEKGYLKGRFGAIPYAGDARSLLARIV
ncbi:AAA family ATPase [Magnetospirillum moscoviense]|uniref:ATPase AAA-type core domain-containing protein n=1 Tax=Magnetospirillum moscoviense TaxID=1437059 RepID=A0A178MGM5_9PROT|nr:ATP-binding protein [Magnetospirillum moscoviense]OAN47840.1 hypothetical protein A6A05_03145 [Magnetospirillum moscoviense]